MRSHKIALKLYARPGTLTEPTKFVEVFHDWIRDGALSEVMIDVADYGHVHHGPAVLFVGHESDYAIDLGEGRPGLVYLRKRVKDDDEATRLQDAFARLLAVAARLEADLRLAPLAFDRREVLLKVLDRLETPNEPASLEREREEIGAVASRALGAEAALESAAPDPREPFTVRIRAAT
jgi:hypothetical protein